MPNVVRPMRIDGKDRTHIRNKIEFGKIGHKDGYQESSCGGGREWRRTFDLPLNRMALRTLSRSTLHSACSVKQVAPGLKNFGRIECICLTDGVVLSYAHEKGDAMGDDGLPSDKELEEMTGINEVALETARTILESGLVPACHAMVQLAATADTPATIRKAAAEFIIGFNLGKGAAAASSENAMASMLRAIKES